MSVSYIKIYLPGMPVLAKSNYSKLRCEESVRLLEAGIAIQEVVDLMHFSSASYFSEFIENQMHVHSGRFMRESQE